MLITVRIKVLPTDVQARAILATMVQFNTACDAIAETAWLNRKFGKATLQKIVYRDIRRDFGLSAQMTVRAIAKVSESYLADRSVQHTFDPHGALVCDQRTLSFKGSDQVSVLTLDGRIIMPIVIPEYRYIDRSRIRMQMDLVSIRGKFYLMAPVDIPEEPTIETAEALGVDMGIVNLAATSDGTTFSGEKCTAVRKAYTAIKGKLQKAATWDAKKHLKRLSGRERRFKRDTNHIISKEIVQTAKDTLRGIALEDLEGIQARVSVTKEQRRAIGKWAFYELGQFIRYKAHAVGVPIYFVDPAYTSQQCSVCGHTAKENRLSQAEFRCVRCGHAENADLNAAKNIAGRADVNQPIALRPPPKRSGRWKCKTPAEVTGMPTTSVVGC